jgi:hypothetical protein
VPVTGAVRRALRGARGAAVAGPLLVVALGAGVLTATAAGATPVPHVDAAATLGPPNALSPVYDHDAPDPDIVPVTSAGTTVYYAYTTASGGGHIPVLSSTDLRTWIERGDALPTLPSWQRPGRTWGPGVVQLGSTFVMYYATDVAASGLQCISSATASSPTGPFVDHSSGPLICQSQLGGSIDPDPFVDSDGTPYLYWKSNAGDAPMPAEIWAARLSPSGNGLETSPTAVVGQDQAWEATVEGPAMALVGGHHVLFYSGGLWDGAGYGVGYTECQGPLGPCSKPLDGPLVHSDRYRLGPGGESVFSDTAGNVYMAYAAWDGPTSTYSYAAGGFRSMWIALVTDAGEPVVHDGEPPEGYLLAGSDGGIFAFGGAAYAGSMGGRALAAPVTGMARDPANGGYWEVASDGGIFAFGGAAYAGSMGGRALAAPVVAMAPTADGNGYWLVGSDGGIFAFGDAPFFGSMGGRALAAPVVGMAPTPDGRGYWLVAGDGGIFAFGDAPFSGSMGGRALAAPVVAIAPMPQGAGYWEVASDGGIFAFGAAQFFGSTGGIALAKPVVAMVAGPGGGGYWLVASDGGIFAFGDADFLGSLGNIALAAPIVAGASA